MTNRRKRRPSAPGKILSAHYMEPREITITGLAENLGVSRKHMSQVVHGKARISAEFALKLSLVLGTTSQFWLNLQNAVDTYDAERHLKNWKPTQCYEPDNRVSA